MSVKLYLDIRKSLPGFELCLKRELEVQGITAVFGPSGAGKTTLLRLIAGFDQPDAGSIRADNEVWGMPASRRPVGYMFQEGRLFPHLTVRGNLDFAEKRAPRGGGYSFDDIVQAFDLKWLLERNVTALSGGEQKRAALARTLLTRPKLLLLDEPFAGLDRSKRRDILPFIESLASRFGVPCLYVSHDIEEVSYLADDVLVLREGKEQAYGPAVDIIGQLDLAPLMDRTDNGVLLGGIVTAQDARLSLTYVDFGKTRLCIPMNARLSVGDNIRLRVRAKDVAIAVSKPEGLSVRNILGGTIVSIEQDQQTAFADVVIDVGSAQLRARITRAAAEDLSLRVDQEVYALVKSMSFEGRLI